MESISEEAMMKNISAVLMRAVYVLRNFKPLIETAKICCLGNTMGSVADNTSGSRYTCRIVFSAYNQLIRCLSYDLKNAILCVVNPGFIYAATYKNFLPKNAAEPHEVGADRIIHFIKRMEYSMTAGFFNWDNNRIPY